MNEKTIKLVQDSFEQLIPIADNTVESFYQRLFIIAPDVKPMFKTDMVEQRKKLVQMLAAAVSGLKELDKLVPVLQDLGRRHVQYGVKDDHYNKVAEALIWALEKDLRKAFTPEVKSAWVDVLTTVATVMIDAAHEAENAAKS